MFYAIGNVGDSKKSDDTRVNNANDPKEHIIEITDADKPLCGFQTGKENNAICPVDEWTTGNTAYDILNSNEYVYDEEGAFESFGGETFEFRYEMEDITEEQREENINTWRDLYKFIVTSTDEEFYAHLKDYFVVDSALYFYLFTERYTMVDNRAKNSFWHYGKVYISNAEAIELGEEEASYYIIDDDAASINNGYRYDLTFAYDMDTALGIDNTGDYVFSYGKEDTDYYVDGDSSSDYVFRVADSTFFCRLRDLFPTEMQAMFKDREEKGAWNSSSLINQWDNSQAKFPEELWRLDYERKYYRTYLGLSIDNSINTGEGKGIDKTFLIGKFFGRKKYARRQFETNQEMYFATKYFGNKALSDVFWIRGNVPIGSSIKPNYSLTLVPYSDMYVCVQYTSTGTPIHKKVKAGQVCTFENDAERMDFIYVYAASYIQEVGDLSRCYPGDNNFSSATRLQKLVIGSTDDGYKNTFMKEVLVANNTLLEYLDLRNVSGINTVINLSGCSNLKELYAEGTNATGVIFANGGLLETAHLPKIGSLSMKNLNYIRDFVVNGYDKLHTLIVENTPSINTYNIVVNAPLLRIVRLIGMNWDATYQIADGSILDRLLTIGGMDSSGYETDMSVLTGNAYVTVLKQKQLEDYQAIWNDLEITSGQVIPQFVATFLNTDGTVLDIQYVDKGYMPVDPVTRIDNPINTPTQESTIDQVFAYIGWDKSFVAMHEPMIFTAVYSSSIREYTIKYVSEFESNPLQITTAPYGSIVEYEGEIPVYTGMEGQTGGYRYHLFDHWDKSGYVDGDKTINAVFDYCDYTGSSYFDGREFNDLRPVEKYMLLKLNTSGDIDITDGTIVSDLDELTFKMGNDYDFDEIESKLLVDDETYLSTGESTVFTGSNYIDTGLAIMNEDRSFVIAIDFEMDSTNAKDATLVECYNPSQSDGFKLSYNGSSPTLYWSTNNSVAASTGEREMIVLRHVKGESSIHVYKSNISGESVEYIEIAHISRDYFTPITQTLVLGCSINLMGKPVSYASGTVHWAKVWYGDLGEVICINLAKFTKEKITTQMCGYNRKILENGTGYGALSFLATHVLRHKSKMMASSGIGTTGGWNETVLKEWLNTRFYDGLPLWMKQLVKPVRVEYIKGGGSTNIETCICNIFIPSITSLSDNKDYIVSPYIDEESAIYGDKYISYMLSNEDRVRKNHNNEAVEYWTRSVYSNPSYFIKIRTDGTPYAFTTSTTELGIVIEFCM